MSCTKPTGRVTRHKALSLFLLFLRQIISRRHLVLGGNPGPPTVWRAQEQRRRPLFFRCSPLFWLEKIQKPQLGHYRRRQVHCAERSTLHTRSDIIATGCCQLNKYSVSTTWIALAGR